MCPVLKMRALAVGLSMAATLVRLLLRFPAGGIGRGSPLPLPATTLYISGGGYGHGIGMSQYGAYGYALHGWTYQQILAPLLHGDGARADEPGADRPRAARERLGGVRRRDARREQVA